MMMMILLWMVIFDCPEYDVCRQELHFLNVIPNIKKTFQILMTRKPLLNYLLSMEYHSEYHNVPVLFLLTFLQIFFIGYYDFRF